MSVLNYFINLIYIDRERGTSEGTKVRGRTLKPSTLLLEKLP
jgi:hypothetical protein